MSLAPELLEILVCPLCKATLEMKPDGIGLKCVQCHRVYPIRDDIPVMLIDEAKIEDELEQAISGKVAPKAALDAAVRRGNEVLRKFEKANP